MRKTKTFLLLCLLMALVPARMIFCQQKNQQSRFIIARVKYHGGGDWYNDPSAIPNLLKFIEQNSNLLTASDEQRVELIDPKLFSFPALFLTGHGRITFSEQEAVNLRKYLIHGGFLYADDDYGMDQYFRQELKKVFPDKELVEIPIDHPIYQQPFQFARGLPKIHEHDGGPPQGFGMFHQGRMIVYYTYNTNISDGWPDPDVHNNPEEVRRRALQMGVNIFMYA
ncbi:MAG: DUF4159 domain-containing protein, partial [bacterium]|nr:DUF4159 domain-containing protein [bacterium]